MSLFIELNEILLKLICVMSVGFHFCYALSGRDSPVWCVEEELPSSYRFHLVKYW